MIRPIALSEYPRLVEIWESAVRATHDFLSDEDFVFFKENLPNYFNAVTLYGFEQNGTLQGFIGVCDSSIEMLFVDNESRHQGIGTALLQYAIQNCRATKVDVNEQNPQAIAFYTKQGFKVASRSETDAQGKPYPILHMEL